MHVEARLTTNLFLHSSNHQCIIVLSMFSCFLFLLLPYAIPRILRCFHVSRCASLCEQVGGQVSTKSYKLKIVTNSSSPLCANGQPSAVYTVRSSIDCQQRCSSSNMMCYFINFYAVSKLCEVFTYAVQQFFTNWSNCTLFKVECHLVFCIMFPDESR